ncbi:MAG: hypothetical protein Q9159_001827 [Coniocarpon cinnabarinum]
MTEQHQNTKANAAHADGYTQQWQHQIDLIAGYPAHPQRQPEPPLATQRSSGQLPSKPNAKPPRSFQSSSLKRKVDFDDDTPRKRQARCVVNDIADGDSNRRSTTSTGRSSVSMRQHTISSSLRRSSASTSLGSQTSSLSSIFPPGRGGAAPRLKPPQPPPNEHLGDIEDDTADETLFFTPMPSKRTDKLSPDKELRQSRMSAAPTESMETTQSESTRIIEKPSSPPQSPASSSRPTRFKEHVEESGERNDPVNIDVRAPLRFAPAMVDPEVIMHIPQGYPGNLPIPLKVSNAVLRLFSTWSSAQDDPKEDTKRDDWRL